MVLILPIGVKDTVHVKGKRLYKRDGSPFAVKGIAFPTPPVGYLRRTHGYNATAWLDVLRQLRDLDLAFNAVRLYRLHPEDVDYHEFFEGAAALGVYVIVPLTSASGDGVLDRTLAAPRCYSRTLFHYGATALREYLKHPNVLAGMVGNEVINDKDAWQAAPCIRAYARDLRLFMDRLEDEGVSDRTLPLIYAMQDASVLGGDEMDKDEALKLTADYLTCAEMGRGTLVPDVAGNEPLHGLLRFEENKFGQSPVDIIGVNVESWCSSLQHFRYNPDGTPGSYYHLYQALKNISAPIIFTEMGCPHSLFDRDDPIRKTAVGTRDWAQVSTVMNEISDTFSGFIAYAYDGPADFAMMSGGPWNGVDTLKPTEDLRRFKGQLDKYSGELLTDADGDIALPRRCSSVESDLISCCDVRLFNDDMIQSFQKTFHVQVETALAHYISASSFSISEMFYIVVISMGFVIYLVSRKSNRSRKSHEKKTSPVNSFFDANGDSKIHYGAIH